MAPDSMTAAGDGSVSYRATASGAADILSVTFHADGRDTTINDPKLPFDEEFAVEAGDTVAMSATGTAKPGGNFTVSYAVSDARGGEPFTAFASCGK